MLYLESDVSGVGATSLLARGTHMGDWLLLVVFTGSTGRIYVVSTGGVVSCCWSTGGTYVVVSGWISILLVTFVSVLGELLLFE